MNYIVESYHTYFFPPLFDLSLNGIALHKKLEYKILSTRISHPLPLDIGKILAF